MSPAPKPMVLAAAKALCKAEADACGISEEDNWNLFSADFIADGQKALDAAGVGEVLEALTRLLRQFPTDIDMLSAGWSAPDINAACDAHDFARAIFAKATGQEGSPA